MTQQPYLNQLSADQLRASAAELIVSREAKDRALVHSNALNDKLTLELAILKRHKYTRRSEQLNALQGFLLDELVDSDLAAIEVELEQAMLATGQTTKPKQQPKRSLLPPELPRTLIHHERDNMQCRSAASSSASAKTSVKSSTRFPASSA